MSLGPGVIRKLIRTNNLKTQIHFEAVFESMIFNLPIVQFYQLSHKTACAGKKVNYLLIARGKLNFSAPQLFGKISVLTLKTIKNEMK